MYNKYLYCAIAALAVVLAINAALDPNNLTNLMMLQLPTGVFHLLSSIGLYHRVRHIQSLWFKLQNYWILTVGFFFLSLMFLLGAYPVEYTVPIFWFIGIPWTLGFYYTSIISTYHDHREKNNTVTL